GPGSTLYGQDAISAVINVITKKPPDEPSGEAAGDAGSNTTREGWLAAGTRFGRARQGGATGFIHYHDSDLTRIDKHYPDWWAPIKAIADLPVNGGDGAVPSRQDFGLNGFARAEGKHASLQFWQRRSRRSSSESGYPQGYLDEAVW